MLKTMSFDQIKSFFKALEKMERGRRMFADIREFAYPTHDLIAVYVPSNNPEDQEMAKDIDNEHITKTKETYGKVRYQDRDLYHDNSTFPQDFEAGLHTADHLRNDPKFIATYKQPLACGHQIDFEQIVQAQANMAKQAYNDIKTTIRLTNYQMDLLLEFENWILNYIQSEDRTPEEEQIFQLIKLFCSDTMAQSEGGESVDRNEVPFERRYGLDRILTEEEIDEEEAHIQSLAEAVAGIQN